MHAGFLRPLLSGGVPIVDEVCQRPATRRNCFMSAPRSIQTAEQPNFSLHSPPAETSIHPGQWYYGFTWTIYVDLVTDSMYRSPPSHGSGPILSPSEAGR